MDTPKSPKLRFKQADGTEYPNWQSVQLGDVAEIKYGKDHKNLRHGDIPCMGTGGIMRYVNIPIYEKPSVLIPRKGSLTSLFFADKPFWTVDTLFYTKIDISKIIPKYLFYHLKTKRLERLNTATGVPSLTTEVLNTVKVPLPHKDEQQKIADFLSNLDNLINAHQQKLFALQNQKTGLMQQIFTQQIRFKIPNGKNCPDWQTLRLEQVADIKMGTSPKSENYNSDKIGLPLFQGNADIENRKTSPKTWTTQYTQKCMAGDILMCVRAPVGDVTICMHNGIIGRGMCLLRSQNNSFLYQVLLNIENQWTRYAQGSTFESINSKDIKSFPVSIPTDKDEQQKIAEFLSNLDNFIQAQTDKITALQHHKQSLLQQMFI